MTDKELLQKALEDLKWAKVMLRMDGGTAHEELDETIAAIELRLEMDDE